MQQQQALSDGTGLHELDGLLQAVALAAEVE